MDYHKNARLTVSLREELAKRVLLQRVTLKLAAASFNVSAKTAAKWVERYRDHGAEALRDRSSRPRSSPRRTPSLLLDRVLALRRLRYNGWRIGRELGLSRATVSRILRRAVANTYTLNNLFGSGVTAGRLGFLLNDTMDDFTSAAGVPNQFGLIQSAAN